MGLDTTHNCWHGGYMGFGVWREELAKAAGIPLQLMERYYVLDDWLHGPPDQTAIDWIKPREGGPLCGSHYGPALYHWIDRITPWLPIKWDALKPDVLHVLLDHSDCDGWIPTDQCAALADRIEELMPRLPIGDAPGHIRNWQTATQQFVDGLRLAASRGENVEFG